MSLPASRRSSQSPATRNPDESRQRILDAATIEFSAKGYAGARIDQIAKRAKLNPRMIYHYFGGKQPLYITVLETGLSELREAERDRKSTRLNTSHHCATRMASSALKQNNT